MLGHEPSLLTRADRLVLNPKEPEVLKPAQPTAPPAPAPTVPKPQEKPAEKPAAAKPQAQPQPQPQPRQRHPRKFYLNISSNGKKKIGVMFCNMNLNVGIGRRRPKKA